MATDLAERIVSRLAPVNAEMNRLLAAGAAKARTIAAPIVQRAKDIVGFLRS